MKAMVQVDNQKKKYIYIYIYKDRRSPNKVQSFKSKKGQENPILVELSF